MSAPTQKAHHIRSEICASRAKYREGREPKAVKVYTINQESRYLLVQGIPSLGTEKELLKLFAVYGTIQEHRVLHEYPAEQFTEVYLIVFEKIQSARLAKKKLDDFSFYGGVLHICYAPEYETVEDTRLKLQDRRKAVARRIRELDAEKPTKRKPSTTVSQADSPHPAEENDVTSPSELSNESHLHLQRNNEPSFTQAAPSVNKPERLAHNGDHSYQEPCSNMTRTDPPPPPCDFPPPRLPPPPRHLLPWQLPPPRPDFDHALVPSSHSTLPPWMQDQPSRMHYPHRAPRPQNTTQNSRFPNRNWNTEHLQPQRNQGNDPTKTITSLNSQNHGEKFSGKFVPRTIPKQEPKSSEKTEDSGSNMNVSQSSSAGEEPLVIKDYKVKGPKPSFVPRQVTKKVDLLKKKNVESKNEFRRTIKDAVNESLRQNAFILDEMKGPQLPENEEKKRKLFQETETGSISLDTTVGIIRDQVKQFSSSLPAPKQKKQKS